MPTGPRSERPPGADVPRHPRGSADPVARHRSGRDIRVGQLARPDDRQPRRAAVRATSCSSCWSAPARRTSACRRCAAPTSSTPSRPSASRGSPATRPSSAASAPTSAGTPPSWCRAPTGPASASAATSRPTSRRPASTRSASTTSSAARTTPAAATRSTSRVTRPPASMRARSSRDGLTEAQLDRFRQEHSHGEGNGLSSYPHPRLMPDYWEFPTVSMGLGAINSIYQARFNRYLHNRGIKDTSGQHVWAFLGDGEMGEPESLGRHRHRGPRGARQPHVRHQLQPAAARRARARQRQDHPGAGVVLPRRRLERHQGRLGTRVGRPARPRHRRRARQPDEPHARRRVPDAVGRVRRLQPRALLRPRPASAEDGRAPSRRADRASPPRRPRLPQGLRGVRRGAEAHRPADRHPRPHHQGLAARVVRGPQRDPPDEEAHQGRPQGLPRPAQHPDLRRADRRRRHRAVLPPGRGQRGDPVHAGPPRGARRIAARAHGRPDAAQAARRRRSTPSSRRARASSRSPRRWRSYDCCATS